MSAQRPLHEYPGDYILLFEKALTEDVGLNFERRSEAINFRVELYNYRKALRSALLSGPHDEKLQDNLITAESITLRVITYPVGTLLKLVKKEPKYVDKIRDKLNEFNVPPSPVIEHT